jgi:hypothetical protein
LASNSQRLEQPAKHKATSDADDGEDRADGGRSLQISWESKRREHEELRSDGQHLADGYVRERLYKRH